MPRSKVPLKATTATVSLQPGIVKMKKSKKQKSVGVAVKHPFAPVPLAGAPAVSPSSAAAVVSAAECWAVVCVRPSAHGREPIDPVLCASVWNTLAEARAEYHRKQQAYQLHQTRLGFTPSLFLVSCTLPRGFSATALQDNICLICDLSSTEVMLPDDPAVAARSGLIVKQLNSTVMYERCVRMAHLRFCGNPEHDAWEECLLTRGHQFIINPVTVGSNIAARSLSPLPFETPSSSQEMPV